MERKQKIKYVVLGIAFLLILLLGTATQRFLTFANLSNEYKEHFNGSCKKIPNVVGGEDITIEKNGVAWISAYDRRGVLQGKNVRGKIYTLNMNSSKPKLIDITPSQPPSFRPHGISLFKAPNGTKYLFVINHPANDVQNILRYNIEPNGKLRLTALFQAPEISSPNDIVAVAADKFYWTNDLGSKRGSVTQTMEVIFGLPWSSLGFYNGKKAKIIFEGLVFGNGVNKSKDGSQIFVAETGGRVNIFDRNKTTNALTLKDIIEIGGVDNLEIDEDGNLWTAAHPKPLLFGAHIENNNNKSPSQVFKIFPEEKQVEEIYYNFGNQISAAATAAPYKNKFLLGPVYDDHLLLCTKN